MIRTQIQLGEDQARMLKETAARNGISMAEAVRQAIDTYLTMQASNDADTRRDRALAAIGTFTAGPRLAQEHDAAFTEEGSP